MRIRVPRAFRWIVKPRDPSAGPESAWRVLGILLAFTLVLWAGTDRLLCHSEAFWAACTPRCGTRAALPLRTEGRLRVAEPGTAKLVVAGSSVARSHVDVAALAAGLGLAPEEVLHITIPRARPAELAMLSDQLVRLEPRAVVFVESMMLGYAPVAWGELRFYDPAVAYRLVGWRGLLAHRDAHAPLALGATNVLIRHRAGVRHALITPPTLLTEAQFWEEWDAEIGLPADAGITLEPPAWDDFSCPNPQTDALALLADRFAEHDIAMTVALAPTRTPWGLEPRITDPIEAYLAAEAAAVGYGYVDGAEARLDGAGSFVDAFHLNEAGRRAYTAWLIEQLAPRFRTKGGGS